MKPKELLKQAKITKMPSLLESSFIVKSNNQFHSISDKITKEVGVPESKAVFREWQQWLKQEIKKKEFKE